MGCLQAVLSGDEMVLSAGSDLGHGGNISGGFNAQQLNRERSVFYIEQEIQMMRSGQAQNYSTPSNRSGSRRNTNLVLDYLLD
jgi:hypothetical protein